MKEPTAEWFAERSDIGLKLWIACCVEELHRRDERGARALAKARVSGGSGRRQSLATQGEGGKVMEQETRYQRIAREQAERQAARKARRIADAQRYLTRKKNEKANRDASRKLLTDAT